VAQHSGVQIGQQEEEPAGQQTQKKLNTFQLLPVAACAGCWYTKYCAAALC
jgi:hypothetical protein